MRKMDKKRLKGVMVMTVEELAKRLDLRILTGDEALAREAGGGYCGDLLSWVMSRAQSGDVWFTVMGNVNSIAVAMLTDVACIVLCEDAPLDEDARARAQEKGIAVLASDENAYGLASRLSTLI